MKKERTVYPISNKLRKKLYINIFTQKASEKENKHSMKTFNKLHLTIKFVKKRIKKEYIKRKQKMEKS